MTNCKHERVELQNLLLDETDQSDESNPEESKLNVPGGGRRKLTLILLCVTAFWGGCVFSLMAPFMPQEAKKKGLSSIQTGIIYGIYQLAIFIVSPFIGNYLTRLGSNLVFSVSLIICGVFTVLLGLTTYLPSGVIFFSAALFCRIADALCTAGALTAMYAISAHTFSDHMSLAFGFIETSMSVGLMVAPGIGGVLYEAGGFWLPFFVVGAMMILNAYILLLFLPPSHDGKQERKGSVFSLLSSSTVWLANLCVFNSAMGAMFMGPTLSLYLQGTFGLSTSLIGLMFVITPTFFGLLSPLWGFMADKKELYAPMMVVGNLMAGIGVLLMGPSPMLVFLPSKIWVIATGLALLGAFNNCGLIPTRKCLFIGAIDLGFENNLDTHGIVNGLFNSVFSLGAFICPIVSGAMAEELGFPHSTTLFGCLFLVSALSSGIYFTIHFVRRFDSNKTYRQARYEKLEAPPSELTDPQSCR